MDLRLRGIEHAWDGRPVLSGVDLDLPSGSMTALVGVNGCGKSTLLGVTAGLVRPDSGSVDIGGDALAALPRREVARRVALMHQSLPPIPGMRARQLVAQGRYPHRGPWGMLGGGTDRVVTESMEAAGVTAFADRELDTLSGGERQRVRLALALAQRPRVLLLDEPVSHLDIRHQLELLDLAARLREEQDITVVAVLHELDLAARYFDRVVALAGGRVAADGTPGDVLTPGLLAEVFGVEGRVVADELHGRPRCIPDRPLDRPA